MKLFTGILLSCFIASLSIVGCTGSSTYSDLLKEQKATISNYIQKQSINVVGSYPSNGAKAAWPDKTFYLSSTGLYYRLAKTGDQEVIDNNDSIRIGQEVIIRYYKLDLTFPQDTIESTWTTLNSAYPYSITYGSTGSEPTAWQEAVSYMKYSGAEAELIVPGTLGTSTDQSNVTPYYYRIKILKHP